LGGAIWFGIDTSYQSTNSQPLYDDARVAAPTHRVSSENGRLTLYYAYDFTEVELCTVRCVVAVHRC
jgi:hypothetical protein